MKEEKIENIQKKLELITGKWWFFLIFILIQFIIPPYASKGYKLGEQGMVIGEILGHPIAHNFTKLYPVFKIIPIILVISIFFLRNKVTRLFSFYAAISYVLFAFLQNIAVTEKYGLGIVTINFLMFLVVAALWFWEVIARKNDFTPRKQPLWKYWVVPIAFLAFWYPLNMNTLRPDFNPLYLFTNMAGLAFCMMTPVYLGILTLFYPRVNIAALRVTSLVGIIIALYNIIAIFPNLRVLWWNGVLHIPLLAISIYALVLSLQKIPVEETRED